MILKETTERHRVRSCERKKWFRSEYDARLAIKNISTDVYQCDYCHGWHLRTKEWRPRT